mgnify:FL=1
MIKSHELVPFVDSLQYLTDKYYYGEPRELYDYRGRILMFADTGIWHHPAKGEVDFDINFGEYLALMLDDPPMTDWIAEWHDDVMPTMLDEMKHYLEHDDSILTAGQLHDVSLSAKHLTKYCLPAADTPEKQAELWHVYELTRAFFLNHMDDLSKAARKSIRTIEQVRTERIKN